MALQPPSGMVLKDHDEEKLSGGKKVRQNIPYSWKESYTKIQICAVSRAVANRLVSLVGHLERWRAEDWHAKETWEEICGGNPWNDHQWSFLPEEASKNKVDKKTHPVALVIFLPSHLLHGPKHGTAKASEMVTTAGISLHQGFSADPTAECPPSQ